MQWRSDARQYYRFRTRLADRYFEFAIDKWQQTRPPTSFKKEFFSAANVHRFVTDHESKNKKLLLTHFNEILSSVHNADDDLSKQRIDVKLQERAEFRSFIPTKSQRSRNASSGATPLDEASFLKLVDSHNRNGHDPFLCGFMVQAALSLRFDNLSDVYRNGPFQRNSKICDCQELDVCSPVLKKSCFIQVVFHGSKNGKPIKSFLTPKVLGCFRLLERLESPLSYTGYNARLKEVVGHEFSSHSLRKLVVNLKFIDARNVGGWQGHEVMRNHYLEDCTLVADFHKFLGDKLK